jgi:DNA-directed RNA polymerase subunit RPC12/RpoP
VGDHDDAGIEAEVAVRFDTEHHPNVVCPKCGHVRRNAWEIDFGPCLDGDAEIECGMCGAVLFVTRYVEVTHTTKVRD